MSNKNIEEANQATNGQEEVNQSPAFEPQVAEGKTPDVGNGDPLMVTVSRILVIVLAVFASVWGGRYIWNNRPQATEKVAETNQEAEQEPIQRVDNDNTQVVNLTRQVDSDQNNPVLASVGSQNQPTTGPQTGLGSSTTAAAVSAVAVLVAHQVVSQRRLKSVPVESRR